MSVERYLAGGGIVAAATIAAAAIAGSPASAVEKAPPRPPAFQKLVDCRPIPDIANRVACYDAQVDALDRAEKDGQVVIADRTQLREARRSLFGLKLPELSLFGRGAARRADDAEFQQIETTIRSARQTGDGGWMIELEDGARWRQTDGQQLATAARPGQKIKIREAALGSFFANVNGQTAIRVRREN